MSEGNNKGEKYAKKNILARGTGRDGAYFHGLKPWVFADPILEFVAGHFGGGRFRWVTHLRSR